MREPSFYQPIIPYQDSSDFTKLKDRWVGLLRHNASLLIKYADEQGDAHKIAQPDMFALANEIEAFFVGLCSK